MGRIAVEKLLWTAIIFFIGTSTALADEPQGGGFFKNIGAVAGQIAAKAGSSVTSGMYSAGLGYAARLTSIALAVGGALALAYFLYSVLEFLSDKKGSILNVIFDVAIPAAFVAYLIQNYAGKMDDFNVLLDNFRNIAPDPLNGIITYYGQILTMIGKAVMETIGTLFSRESLLGAFQGKLVGNFLDAFATIIFAIVILFIALSGLAEVLGLVLLGPFLFAVGIAFGPIMIASLVTPWTKDYFGKWLGFIVGTAVLTGVVGISIAIASTVLSNLNISTFTADVPISVTLAASAIMIMAVNSIIAQAPSIASAMVPGSIGASQGSGKAVTEAAKEAGGRAGGAISKTSTLKNMARDRMSKAASTVVPGIGAKIP